MMAACGDGRVGDNFVRLAFLLIGPVDAVVVRNARRRHLVVGREGGGEADLMSSAIDPFRVARVLFTKFPVLGLACWKVLRRARDRQFARCGGVPLVRRKGFDFGQTQRLAEAVAEVLGLEPAFGIERTVSSPTFGRIPDLPNSQVDPVAQRVMSRQFAFQALHVIGVGGAEVGVDAIGGDWFAADRLHFGVGLVVVDLVAERIFFEVVEQLALSRPAALARAACREHAPCALEILHGDGDLPDVVDAGGSSCRFSSRVDGWEQEQNEDGDDGNDDK